MEIIYFYTIPSIISFLLMNACYEKGIVDGAFSAIFCFIPIVNIIMIFYYIKQLINDKK